MTIVGVIVIIAFLVGGVGLVVWLIVRERRAGRTAGQIIAAFSASLDRLGARVEGPDEKPLSNRWHVERNGRSWEAGYNAGGRGPPTFFIKGSLDVAPDVATTPFRAHGDAPLPHPPRLKLRTETGRDRFGKALRLNRELQTGDPAFDHDVYIESDDDDALLMHVLQAPPLRRAVKALLDHDCDHLALCGDIGPLEVRWSGAQKRNPFERHGLDDALTELELIADTLPTFATEASKAGRTPGVGGVTATVLAGVVAFALVALAYNLAQPVSMAPLQGYGGAGLGVALVVVLAVGVQVRGTSRALRMVGWTLGLGWITWPAFCVGAAMAINGFFDGSVAPRTVNVERRYTTRSKNNVTHYVELSPWPPHESIKLRVSEDTYRRLRPGRQRLRIGAGNLGIEWYAGPVE